MPALLLSHTSELIPLDPGSVVFKQGDLGFTTCPFDLIRVSGELGSFQSKNRQTSSIRITLLSTFPRRSERVVVVWWLSLSGYATDLAGSGNRSRACLGFPSVCAPLPCKQKIWERTPVSGASSYLEECVKNASQVRGELLGLHSFSQKDLGDLALHFPISTATNCIC